MGIHSSDAPWPHRHDTLGAIKAHSYLLAAHCETCRRWRWLDTDALIAELGAEFKIVPERLNALMRCANCGRKSAHVQLSPPARDSAT